MNLHQIDESEIKQIEASDNPVQGFLDWIESHEDHDVTVCTCCGNGDEWYGEPGSHDSNDNGPDGPYAYNGGLPECN